MATITIDLAKAVETTRRMTAIEELGTLLDECTSDIRYWKRKISRLKRDYIGRIVNPVEAYMQYHGLSNPYDIPDKTDYIPDVSRLVGDYNRYKEFSAYYQDSLANARSEYDNTLVRIKGM